MTRVLFDVNVILDVLANREPHAEASTKALSLVEKGTVEGVLAAHTVTTLHDLIERELGPARTRRALSALLGLLEVEPVDGPRLREALASGWKDFEDAVQSVCAVTTGADYIVTRDKRGFKKSNVSPLTPSELLALTA